MPGATRGSGFAESPPAIPAASAAPRPERRWIVLRRAARARLAPVGAAVVLLAALGAVLAPLVAPHDPLKQNLGNALARPDRVHPLGTDNVGRAVLSPGAAPMVVRGGRSVACPILAGGSLSSRGRATQPPAASWGSMINAGRGYLQQAPWIVFGPGAALFVTVVGLNFVGDAIRDALDPRARS